jgi:hypothetical protein
MLRRVLLALVAAMVPDAVPSARPVPVAGGASPRAAVIPPPVRRLVRG